MECNLKTVSLSNGTVKVSAGWFASSVDPTVHIEGLGHLLSSRYLVRLRPAYHLLMAASIGTKTETRKTPVWEDDPYDMSEEYTVNVPDFRSEPDGRTYYRIFTEKSESLSKDFTIHLTSKIEDIFHADKYNSVIYASLPEDLPLILDSNGTLCISPL